MSTDVLNPPRPRPKKIERLPPLPPPATVYRRNRKRIHLACVIVFVGLPFFDVMRFDLPRQRFYFAGVELWINEFAIIFFALMLLMYLLAASAILYGRVYCSYLCPQMIFSEAANALEAWSRKTARRLPGRAAVQTAAARGLLYGVLFAGSIFLAFVFTSYFVEPRDLLGRLLHLDLKTTGGITGAAVTMVTFLDFAFLRQRFCTTVCPYGYLQGMLQDRQTLLVAYRDPQERCIECGKCVRVCEMAIDIRNGPYQIECVHCGECVDACEDVMRKVGYPGLITHAWGERDTRSGRESLLRRLGFRDAKRIAIAAILLFYVAGLGTALSMRRTVMVQLAPDRSVLFVRTDDGRIANRIRARLVNRGHKTTTVRLSITGAPGAEVMLPVNPVPLQPGEVWERTFEIRVAPWPGASALNPVQLVAQPANEHTPDVYSMNLILPDARHAR